MIAPVLILLVCSIADPVTNCASPAESTQQSDGAAHTTVTGIVRDASGLPVAGASIVIRTGTGFETRTTSGADGRFTVPLSATGDLLVVVRADGFAETRQRFQSGSAAPSVEIVLAPATLAETVTVTASRVEQRTGDIPASVTVLGRETIRQSPAVVADDVLRQVPTFSLFRRTSSLASHPTTQGVSLRGIGPSGVSRTLVLLDGIPFNDPFGGWVYWTRVPLEAIERIEAVEGTTSSLYGNYAMGGVINIVTAPATRRTIELRSQYGTRNSPKIDAVGSDVWGPVRVIADVSAFSTDGYMPVVESERGRVDTRAAVDFTNVNLKLQYDPTARVQAFVRGGYFRENRDNGKVSTIDGTEEANDTRWTSASGGVRVQLPGDSLLQVNAFTDDTRLHSNFLAVPAATPPRSLGRMTLNQTVPVSSAGAGAQWSRAFASHQLVTAGADWRWVDGDSREDGLDAQTGTQVTLKRISGGTQRSLGAFAQDVITPTTNLTLTISARVDGWRNYDAHNLEVNYPSGTPTANNKPTLPDRDDTVVSPRAAARYQIASWLGVWGDLGWGFRAPTLNELYRQFRVGTVLTLANDQLGPERLVGGEAGIRITPGSNLAWRTTWFGNRVRDPVSNVTIATAGANVTQQRQNLGRTRIRGLQTDVDYRLGTSWRLSGAYMFNSARVAEFAANPALVGKYLPQVPRHRGSMQLAYTNPRYVNLAVGFEATGRQFDDDLNERVVPGQTKPGLPGYALLGFTVSRSFGRTFDAFVSAQNLFDEEYFVGTLPTTVGSPRLVSVGVRVRWTGK
ncbi:MAG TPA: TonB-dependent receptor [Vicinamibacterales bacterium]|jgi:iron complex outermembrane receptor protein|nr:TonB-dependent receptor [Vicinamibacterales bacterium]